MNAYWMNELVYEGVACPEWLAITLFTLIGIVVIGSILAIILVNKN